MALLPFPLARSLSSLAACWHAVLAHARVENTPAELSDKAACDRWLRGFVAHVLSHRRYGLLHLPLPRVVSAAAVAVLSARVRNVAQSSPT